MRFQTFKNEYKHRSFILSREVVAQSDNPQVMLNQLSRWQKKGLIIALRKGLYVLNENDRAVQLSRSEMANVMYEPSYVSLDYALNYYGLIPERVFEITSITTRKTWRCENAFGRFVYHHVQPKAFRGFKQVDTNGRKFFLAEPEKAVVDFIYFHLAQFHNDVAAQLQESYRFQNMEDLDTNRILQCGSYFENKRLMKVLKQAVQWIREEQKND